MLEVQVVLGSEYLLNRDAIFSVSHLTRNSTSVFFDHQVFPRCLDQEVLIAHQRTISICFLGFALSFSPLNSVSFISSSSSFVSLIPFFNILQHLVLFLSLRWTSNLFCCKSPRIVFPLLYLFQCPFQLNVPHLSLLFSNNSNRSFVLINKLRMREAKRQTSSDSEKIYSKFTIYLLFENLPLHE